MARRNGERRAAGDLLCTVRRDEALRAAPALSRRLITHDRGDLFNAIESWSMRLRFRFKLGVALIFAVNGECDASQ